MPEVSVIIPTYNGRGKLKELLVGLKVQSYRDFETIIVVDGSTDGTADYLRNQDWNLKNLKVVEQPNRGRSAVRNRGAQEASGTVLIFLDDDMRPQPDCIQAHLELLDQYENGISVGITPDQVDQYKSDFERFKAAIADGWIDRLVRAKQPFDRDTLFLAAANLGINKATFDKLGGFNEALTDAEDHEMGLRALAQGIDVRLNASAVSLHFDPVTCQSYIARLIQYKQAHRRLEELDSSLGTKRKESRPRGLKGLVFYLFSFPRWVQIIDDWGYLRVLPRKLRYKVYDLVITSQSFYFRAKTHGDQNLG